MRKPNLRRWLEGWLRKLVGTEERSAIENRRLDILHTLLREVFPQGTPYQYDVAPSFLQRELDLTHPIRVSLVLPQLPLIIDVMGPEASPLFAQAEPYTTRVAWEALQEELLRKRQLIQRYGCPYLVVHYFDTATSLALKERVSTLLGRNP